MRLSELSPDCLAVIYSFLLGSYSYYDHATSSDQNSNDSSDSDPMKNFTQKFVTMGIIGSSIFPLKHSCRDLFWKLHDNVLIWDHAIIPFPDVLSSKYLKFVEKVVDNGVTDDHLIDSADSLYELFKTALQSICNLNLIKKLSMSRLIRSNYKNMDYTMFIMKLLPNIEELYLNVSYSKELALFNPKKFIWNNLQHVTVADYKTLHYFVTNAKPYGLKLKTIRFYVARKKRESMELIANPQYLLEEYLEKIEMTSNIGFQDLEYLYGLLSEKRKSVFSFLRVSNEYYLGAGVNDGKFIEAMAQISSFSNLRHLYIHGSSKIDVMKLSGSFNELTDLTVRSSLSDRVIHFQEDFIAPKLKNLCLTGCKLLLDTNIKFKRLRYLLMDTCDIDSSFDFDKFPLLSQFTYSTNPCLIEYSKTLNISFVFANMKHLRQVYLSDCHKIDISNCTELKLLKIAKCQEANVHLPNNCLSYFKLEHVPHCNITIDECEKLFMRYEVSHKIEINRVRSFTNLTTYLYGVYNTACTDVSIKQIDWMNYKASNAHQNEKIFHSIDNIDKLVIQSDSHPNGFTNYFCSTIYENFIQKHFNRNDNSFLNETIRDTGDRVIIPSKIPLKELSVDTRGTRFISPQNTESITHLKISKQGDGSIIMIGEQDFSNFPNLISLSLRKLQKFPGTFELKYLKYIYFEGCTECRIEMSFLPSLEEMIITGKNTELTLTSKTGYVWNTVKLINIYCIKNMNLSAKQIEAPNLREFVVTDITSENDPQAITFKSSPNLIFFYFLSSSYSSNGKNCLMQ